jgi:hypothetical protein
MNFQEGSFENSFFASEIELHEGSFENSNAPGADGGCSQAGY